MISLIATQTTETTHNFHTKNITSDGEPIPTSIKSSKKGGIEAQREQLQKQELNVVAVVIPVVLAFFLVCMRLTIVFYITGARKKKNSVSKELTFPTSTVAVAYTNETFVSEEIELYTEVKNQHVVDASGQLCSRNPLYEPTTSPDALVVVTQACESNNLFATNNSMPRFTEADHLYTEVKKLQDCNEVPSVEQENENPLYETTASVHIVADNHIYDSTT